MAEFVRGEETIPHPVTGLMPVYDGHPPDTVLPGWRCPDCGTSMPTIYEIWKADKNRLRLADERLEVNQGSEQWHAYTDGIHHYRDELNRMFSALPANVSSWVRDEVL